MRRNKVQIEQDKAPRPRQNQLFNSFIGTSSISPASLTPSDKQETEYNAEAQN